MRYRVVVVGSGGTGSYFLKEFARFCATSQVAEKIQIVVVDGDVVEEKNLQRQNFFEDSIGNNKAVDMVQLISDTYPNVNICAYPHYLLEEGDVENVFSVARELIDWRYGESVLPVLVGAVDNHRCRQLMEQWFGRQVNAYYIDSANEFEEGEVVFSLKVSGQSVSPVRSEYFKEVATDTSPNVAEMSCSELNAAAPQHILTNMLAANISLSGLLELIENQQPKKGIVYFNVRKGYMEYFPYVLRVSADD